jgi:hypothetical protein
VIYHKPWATTDEGIDKMDGGRKCKSIISVKIEEQIQRPKQSSQKSWAKEKCWEEQYNEIENLDKLGKTDVLHRRVTNLT